MTKDLLIDMFDLRFDEKKAMKPFPFSIGHQQKVLPPDWLGTWKSFPMYFRFAIILKEPVAEEVLACFSRAGYDSGSEAYCRIPIDCMVTAAKLEESAKEEESQLPSDQPHTEVATSG
jgi:hypothetical protein